MAEIGRSIWHLLAGRLDVAFFERDSKAKYDLTEETTEVTGESVGQSSAPSKPDWAGDLLGHSSEARRRKGKARSLLDTPALPLLQLKDRSCGEPTANNHPILHRH